MEVLDDVKRFFDAVESGRWEEIDAAHQALLQPGEGLNQPRSAELHQIWRSIQETWGAAREAHNWPAQKLLDYGEAVLGSLKPGMIYVGGTDPGCFIPTFLNETSDGERHITLTQNALADGTYLDYLNFLYADRLQTLTQDDSQHAFQNYITDAQKRFQHDQEHPDEPKQVRPGEDIQVNEGRVQVSGQVAVMAINEKLLQTLMDKNPGLSFAMEESFPMASTYTSAAPLGPLLELKRPDGQNNLTVEEARQALDYWRDMSHRFETDTDTLTTPDSRTAYAQMAVAQGNLFASKNYSTEAEQAYRIASELSPSYSTPVENLVALLVRAERSKEGFQLLDNFARNNPDQRVSIEEWRKVLLKQYGSK
ncbi:MAG: hypothetical protein EPO07_05270 [Verrucomicrobia bacterium]|nr:MAG: hypothetical protein EPO07_05270 [Verrucomicrobiota bacterium]